MTRRAWWPVLLALVLAVPPAAGQVPEDAAQSSFREGNRLYEAGDFAGAAGAYQRILDLGLTSREVEFNLGNAYLKAGRLGPAILHYRRALALHHAYESARQNLNYARSLTQDVKPEERASSRLAWVGRLRLGPVTAAALLFTVFTGFLLVAALRLRPWRERAWAAVLQGVLGGLALLLAGATLFEWRQAEGRDEGVIMVEEVDVRTGPGDTYTVGFRLHEGTEVEILRETSGWREVKVSDRLQGWVPGDGVAGI